MKILRIISGIFLLLLGICTFMPDMSLLLFFKPIRELLSNSNLLVCFSTAIFIYLFGGLIASFGLFLINEGFETKKV